jgi:methionyl-tRNA synthetase
VSRDCFYITTPIYYVNDRPHVGHLYSTTLADVAARAHRLRGDEVFFLTGTDEHADKVAEAAAQRGLAPIDWANANAGAFRETFAAYGIRQDDFVRTSEERHTVRVQHWVRQLLDSGDLYLGDYEGWYDPGEEEYVPDGRARDCDYRSPVSGRPLVRRREQNYFFRLSAYEGFLLELHERARPDLVQPEERRNEVVGRVRQGLLDVPASRTGHGGWGIPFPSDPEHAVYVWVDALFNYLSVVDTDERRHLWPADVHLIGKDILWFHAVIWPALLEALRRVPGNEWIGLPRRIHAHAHWVAEGQKMSKSLGNFIDLEQLDRTVARYGLDALRWFFVTQGPFGASDADFAEARFAEVYQADLANAVGNCASRVLQMTSRYFGGRLPAAGAHALAGELERAAAAAAARFEAALARFALDDCARAGLELVRAVDGAIEKTRPFQLARDPARLAEAGAVLHDCAEALRVASLLLWPVLPGRIELLWQRLGCSHLGEALRDRGRGRLAEWARWGGLAPGALLQTGDPLFPRGVE